VYEKQSNIKSSDNEYCKFDSQTLTLFTSSLYLAALVASVLASTVTRLFGRRFTMISGGVLFLAGAGLNAFAQHVWMLIVGRMLLGFGIGCANKVIYVYSYFVFLKNIMYSIYNDFTSCYFVYSLCRYTCPRLLHTNIEEPLT